MLWAGQAARRRCEHSNLSESIAQQACSAAFEPGVTMKDRGALSSAVTGALVMPSPGTFTSRALEVEGIPDCGTKIDAPQWGIMAGRT